MWRDESSESYILKLRDRDGDEHQVVVEHPRLGYRRSRQITSYALGGAYSGKGMYNPARLSALLLKDVLTKAAPCSA